MITYEMNPPERTVTKNIKYAAYGFLLSLVSMNTACASGFGHGYGEAMQVIMVIITLLVITILSTLIAGFVCLLRMKKGKPYALAATVTALSSLFPACIAGVWVWANVLH